MPVIIFYLIACIPVAFAGIMCALSKKINLLEVLAISAIGFIASGIFHFIAIHGMTGDVQYLSGYVTSAKHTPTWVEYYEEAIYKTVYYKEKVTEPDSKGKMVTRTVERSKQVFSHWEPTTRVHSDSYYANDTIGALGFFNSINSSRYQDIVSKFGSEQRVPGSRTTGEHKSRMISGDPMDYIAENKNNFVYPTNRMGSWENKIKACPSVFSFKKYTKEQAQQMGAYDYPISKDIWSSQRLLGAVPINPFFFDQFNAELGASKKINVIIVNFGDKNESIAEVQQAYWVGGKKNDLVVCYGTKKDGKTAWVKTFGWTESENVKTYINKIFMENNVSNDILYKMRDVIVKHYVIKDWRKFDYLTVEIPFSYGIYLLIAQLIMCIAWFFVSYYNEFDR